MGNQGEGSQAVTNISYPNIPSRLSSTRLSEMRRSGTFSHGVRERDRRRLAAAYLVHHVRRRWDC